MDKDVLLIVVGNVAIVAVFALLAQYFDKWWIAIFSILCLMSYKSDKK